MPILFTCTCGKTLKANDSLAGRMTKCPQCGTVLEIPSAEVEEEFAEGLSQAMTPVVPPADPGQPRPLLTKTTTPRPAVGSIREYAYLLLGLALIPLVFSLLNKDEAKTFVERIEATLQKATPEEVHRAERSPFQRREAHPGGAPPCDARGKAAGGPPAPRLGDALDLRRDCRGRVPDPDPRLLLGRARQPTPPAGHRAVHRDDGHRFPVSGPVLFAVSIRPDLWQGLGGADHADPRVHWLVVPLGSRPGQQSLPDAPSVSPSGSASARS